MSFFKRSRFCSPEHEALWQEREALLVQRLLQATVPEPPPLPSAVTVAETPAPVAPVADESWKELPALPLDAPPVVGFLAVPIAKLCRQSRFTLLPATILHPPATRSSILATRGRIVLDPRGLPRLPACSPAKPKGFLRLRTTIPIPGSIPESSAGAGQKSRRDRPKQKGPAKALLVAPRTPRFPAVAPPSLEMPAPALVRDTSAQRGNRTPAGLSALVSGQRPFALARRTAGARFVAGTTPQAVETSVTLAAQAKAQNAGIGTPRAPGVKEKLASGWRTPTTVPVIAPRLAARHLPSAPPLPVLGELSELLGAKTLASGPVLETPERIVTEGRGLPRLPVCRRSEQTLFSTLPAALVIRAFAPDKAGDTREKRRGKRLEPKFPYATFQIEPRRHQFPAVTLPSLEAIAPAVNRNELESPGNREPGWATGGISERPPLTTQSRGDRRPVPAGSPSAPLVRATRVARADAPTAFRAAGRVSDQRPYTMPRRPASRKLAVASAPQAVEFGLTQAALPAARMALDLASRAREASGAAGALYVLSVARRAVSRSLTAASAPQAVEFILTQAALPETLRAFEPAAEFSARPTLTTPRRAVSRGLAAHTLAVDIRLTQAALTEAPVTIAAEPSQTLRERRPIAISGRAANLKLAAGGYPQAALPFRHTQAALPQALPARAAQVSRLAIGRGREALPNATFLALPAKQIAPILWAATANTRVSRNTPTAIGMRAPARYLPVAQSVPIGRESGELFSPKVYVHGLVLPNPDRIALKGHSLLRLPVCTRVELTGFSHMPATPGIHRGILATSAGAGEKLRGGLRERQFPYGAFQFGQRKSRFDEIPLVPVETAAAVDRNISEQLADRPSINNMIGTTCGPLRLPAPRRPSARRLAAPTDSSSLEICPMQAARAQAQAVPPASVSRVIGDVTARSRQQLPGCPSRALAAAQSAPIVESTAVGAWRQGKIKPPIASRLPARLLPFAPPQAIGFAPDGFEIRAHAPEFTWIGRDCEVLNRPPLALQRARLQTSAAVSSFWRDPSALESPKIRFEEPRLVRRDPASANSTGFEHRGAGHLSFAAGASIWRIPSLLPDPKIGSDAFQLVSRSPEHAVPRPSLAGPPRQSLGRPTFVLWPPPAALRIAGAPGFEMNRTRRTLPLELRLRARKPEDEISTRTPGLNIPSAHAPETQPPPNWQPYKIGGPIPIWPAGTLAPAVAPRANEAVGNSSSAQELTQASTLMFGPAPPPEKDAGAELIWSSWKVSSGY